MRHKAPAVMPKNIAVFFGDDTFPKKGRGRSTKKFEEALSRVGHTLQHLNITHLFLPSYKGTNVVAGLLLKKLEIPYTLVIPHPSFGNMSSLRSKVTLSLLSKAAERTIILGDTSSDTDILYDIESVTDDFVDYISKHCNAIIVAHSEDMLTSKFSKLIDRFPEDTFEKAYKFTY